MSIWAAFFFASRQPKLARVQAIATVYLSRTLDSSGAPENPIRKSQTAIYRNVGGSSVLLQSAGKMDRGGIAENAATLYTSPLRRAVTHSPINFGGRSIDHNVLFCSLVFLPAAFDSIRGCGESIYLSRCHEPPVMDGGCSLTLTPKREAVPRTCP